MKPTIGRTLHYILTPDDAAFMNRERLHNPSRRGNGAIGGEHMAMIVVGAFGGHTVNGQVLLDGNDSIWKTSVAEGTTPGTWHWPEREE